MAKFSGTLAVITGYTSDHGVYTPDIKKYKIQGDLLNSSYSHVANEKINDDLSFSNRYSFLASPSLITALAANSSAITSIYLEYVGIKMKVTNIQFQPPRVIISTGGLWSE